MERVSLLMMSDFRTVLQLPSLPNKIGIQDSVFTIGSCFADNLGKKLTDNKFSVAVNPFGTSYNPVSIQKQLVYALTNGRPSSTSYGELNDTYFNFDFHSSFSTLNRQSLENNISNAIEKQHSFLTSAKVLMITYGTAWVYERNENSEIVSNCHKVPGSAFKKSLLTQKKILESFETLHKQLTEFNSDLRIILTLSPVRHIKDTLELNAVSKAVLRLTCHTLSELYKNVSYFPAFEIVMDDLRDYRFYDRDLLHPSQEAIDYIWKKFRESYLDQLANGFIDQWEPISKALQHKPFQPKSIAHQKFLKQTLTQLENLKGVANVNREIQQIKQQLIN
ncbi:MAG: GSCFA domain-containing protein [Cyclobacteriaceae bacterium]